MSRRPMLDPEHVLLGDADTFACTDCGRAIVGGNAIWLARPATAVCADCHTDEKVGTASASSARLWLATPAEDVAARWSEYDTSRRRQRANSEEEVRPS